MSEMEDLYQEVILDHYRSPRNSGVLTGANRTAHGDNPLCGDKLVVMAIVENSVVRNIGFKGTGCALSIASASLMTECIKGRTIEETEKLFHAFHGTVAGSGSAAGASLGKLDAFSGVREYPARVKCVTLAWHTLQAALAGSGETVTTESGG